MFYQFLRLIVFIAVKIFFRSAHLRNLEHLPKKGGLLLASNHPSTFLDPLVLAVWIKRPIYFLTNGGVFKNPLLKWIFRQFYMVPIYRRQDSQESAAKNEEAFAACYETLAAGGALVIFPEGGSEDERNLRKIKTGLARIALGAEAAYNFKLGVQIVCAGINYSNPRQFQSDLFVQYALPFGVEGYAALYAEQPQQAVATLTAHVEQLLKSLIVVIPDKETDELVHQIEVLYSHQLQRDLELPSHNTEQIFTIAQHFADAVQHFQATDPQRMAVFKEVVTTYFDKLATYKLQDKTVANYTPKQNWLATIPILVGGFPVYLLGILHNFLPYQLPAWLARSLTKDSTFLAAFNFGLGIVCFSIFYAAYGVLFWQFFPSIFGLLAYYAVLVGAGFAGYYYWHFAKRLREKAKLQTICKQDATLLPLREQIIAELEKSKVDYMSKI